MFLIFALFLLLHFTYNSFGSVTSAIDENGNKTQLVTDNGGILQQRIEADGATTNYGYDGNGNLTSVIDPLGKVTSMKYDAAFHLTERDGPNGEVTKFTYDPFGRLASKIDPLNRTTTRHYRADGVLQSITQPDNTVITFDNDVNGRRTGVTDPDGNHTTFAYNGNSQVTSQIDPLGKITSYLYDPAGNLSSVTDRLGRIRQFAYNNNNQLTTESWYANITATTPLKTIATSYDPLGNVTDVNDDTGDLSMQYDGRNRLQTLTTNYTGQNPFVLNYGYDLGSRVTSVQDEAGVQVATSYDPRNQVSQITWQGASIAPARIDMAHSALGDLTSMKRYADLAGQQFIGQTVSTYGRNLKNIGYQAAAFNAGDNASLTDSFKQTEAFGPLQNNADAASLVSGGNDSLARITDQTQFDKNGNVLIDENYVQDAAGQLLTKTTGGDTTTYGYDQTGQLKSVNHSANTSANEAYSYDPSGNRQATNTVIGTNNRILSDPNYSYGYDDEGNLISKTETATGRVWTYLYDHRNRLVQATQTQGMMGTILSQASYSYDVMDRRIAKTVNGATTQFSYENDNLWKQVDSTGNSTRYLTDGATDRWIARYRTSSGAGFGLNFYLADRLGSVTGITDNTGALINSTKYDSYGHILSQSNPTVADQFAFTGREYDAETGLYYFRARYYSPDLGRFLSGDPTKFAASDFNLMRYGLNNPLLYKDATGLTIEEEEQLSPGFRQKAKAIAQKSYSSFKNYWLGEIVGKMTLPAALWKIYGPIEDPVERGAAILRDIPGYIFGISPYGLLTQSSVTIQQGLTPSAGYLLAGIAIGGVVGGIYYFFF